MTSEPVVVVVGTHPPYPRRAAVADVLFIPPPGGTGEVGYADLFRRYPGLTLVVSASAAGELSVAVRDGQLITVRADGAEAVDVTRLAYRWWAARVDPASTPARREAASAGLRLSVGSWLADGGEAAANVGGSTGALALKDPQG